MDFELDLLPDDFSRQLVEGCLRVAKDRGNPVRLHNFAGVFRELFSYILHLYAPEEEVRACSWFVQAEDTPKVTRLQRAVYATQGGLSDEFISTLGLDVDHLHKVAIKAIDELHKATHVRPDTLITEDDQIEDFIRNSFSALKGLLSSFQICRASVVEALEEQVYSSVSESLLTKTFDQIDILAGRGYEVDTSMLGTEITIEAIKSNEIFVKFTGIAPVILHYGKNEDAAEIPHDFPFWMKFTAPTKNPHNLEYIASHFDHSSWVE